MSYIHTIHQIESYYIWNLKKRALNYLNPSFCYSFISYENIIIMSALYHFIIIQYVNENELIKSYMTLKYKGAINNHNLIFMGYYFIHIKTLDISIIFYLNISIYGNSRLLIVGSYCQTSILSFAYQSQEPIVVFDFNRDEVITRSVWFFCDIIFGLKSYMFGIISFKEKVISYLNNNLPDMIRSRSNCSYSPIEIGI